MFNATHILYMLFSAAISIAVVAVLSLLKNDKLNRAAIWFFAIATVIIHFSGIWHAFFTEGNVIASVEYILPVFPCHICMWLLVISATTLNSNTRAAKLLRDFTFLGGSACGMIGILLNESFANNPTLTDYYVLKGLLSHSTMVLGCILLFVAGYAGIGIKRSLTATLAGIALFTVDGIVINRLFLKHGLGEQNAMFLQYAPFEEFPFINAYTVYGAAIVTALAIGALYELFFRGKQA